MTYKCFCRNELQQAYLSHYKEKKPITVPFLFEAYKCPECKKVYFSDEQTEKILESMNELKSSEAFRKVQFLDRLYDDSIRRIEDWIKRRNNSFHYLQSHFDERLEDWRDLLRKNLENIPLRYKPDNLRTMVENDMENLLKNHPVTIKEIIRDIGVTSLLTMVTQNTCIRLSSELKPFDITKAFNNTQIGLWFSSFYRHKRKLAEYLDIGKYDPVKIYESVKDSLENSGLLDNYPILLLDGVVYEFLTNDKNLKKLEELYPRSVIHYSIPPIVYIASILIGKRITQRKISIALGAKEITLLRERYKKIKKNFEITVKL